MVQFKALMLVSLVIMTLNSCSNQPKNSLSKDVNKVTQNTMVSPVTISILKRQYKVLTNKKDVLHIEIKEDKLLDRILSTNNPVFKIEFENSYIIAKGNNIFNSGVPNGCDYFYPLDNANKVVIFKKGIVNLTKIDKTTR